MIQLFLTLLLLIILIIIIRTKESFYDSKCPTENLVLNAMNDIDIDNNNTPCIKLKPNQSLSTKDLTGYIFIKNKNAKTSKVIDLEEEMIQLDDDKNINYIKLTKDIVLGETYLITLNVINNDILHVYDTVEITFRKVTLSDDNLNTNCKSNRDKLIDELKTKKNIILSL
jgi:hypothetical protein